jgi:hypothetical protein
VKRPRTDGVGGEQVASLIANMNPVEVYQIVQQTKQIVDTNPDQVECLFVFFCCCSVLGLYLQYRGIIVLFHF